MILTTNVLGTTTVVPKTATKYLLTADDNLPTLKGEKIKEGILKLPAHSIVFLTFEKV